MSTVQHIPSCTIWAEFCTECMLPSGVQVHHGMRTLPGDEEHLVSALGGMGFQVSKHGEYDVWASKDLHPYLRHKHLPPQPI